MSKGLFWGLVASTAGWLFAVWMGFLIADPFSNMIGMEPNLMKTLLTIGIVVLAYRSTREILDGKNKKINELIDLLDDKEQRQKGDKKGEME